MIDALIDDFLKMMLAEKGASLNTIDAYRRDMLMFFDICKQTNLRDITKQDVAVYVQKLSEFGYATRSIARKVASLREFFKFLYTENKIKDNPALYLFPPKREKLLPKFLE